jgi:tRNA(adenine34) deaminase
MDLALKTAESAGKAGEVPIGCVIVRGYEVIATAGNRTLTDRDPTAHAEILAIRQAADAIGTERLVDCDLYVTLEPCTMCAGAISFARIRRLYYGAADPKGGAVDSGVRFLKNYRLYARRSIQRVGETRRRDLKDASKAKREKITSIRLRHVRISSEEMPAVDRRSPLVPVLQVSSGVAAARNPGIAPQRQHRDGDLPAGVMVRPVDLVIGVSAGAVVLAHRVHAGGIAERREIVFQRAGVDGVERLRFCLARHLPLEEELSIARDQRLRQRVGLRQKAQYRFPAHRPVHALPKL